MSFKGPRQETDQTRPLRDYQREAVDSVQDAWRTGTKRPAIVLPTGTGKTDVIARIATDAARAGQRVMALAHRGELLDQITERCLMHAPDIPVGRVQAARNQGRRPITVAMAQTLASEKRQDRLPIPQLVIADECHHAASPSQMGILRWAGCFDRTPAMGVTATMVRGDKRGLLDVWQEVVFQRDIRWAIDSGWLVEPRGRAVVVPHLDLAKAKVRRGDFTDGELGEMVAQDVDKIAKAWHEHARDRRTVAFTPSVVAAQQLAEEFRRIGVAVGEVYGFTPPTERKRIYSELAEGQIQVLVSVMVTTEGWDCPPVECILQCRPTKLPGLYQQMVGRGLRPSPETGKRDCLVLDVVGASRTLKLVTLIDLHGTVAYNTDEIDELPCEECGQAPCECPPGEGTRDPDGGRLRLETDAEYEDIDMFAASALNWLFTRRGVRFLPAGNRMALLWPEGEDSSGQPLVMPGHCTVRGRDQDGKYIGRDGKWLTGEPVPLHQGRQLAESWAYAYDPSVSARGSSWRTRGGSASPAQLDFARGLRVETPELLDKSQLSDAISVALASKVLDR